MEVYFHTQQTGPRESPSVKWPSSSSKVQVQILCFLSSNNCIPEGKAGFQAKSTIFLVTSQSYQIHLLRGSLIAFLFPFLQVPSKVLHICFPPVEKWIWYQGIIGKLRDHQAPALSAPQHGVMLVTSLRFPPTSCQAPFYCFFLVVYSGQTESVNVAFSSCLVSCFYSHPTSPLWRLWIQLLQWLFHFGLVNWKWKVLYRYACGVHHPPHCCPKFHEQVIQDVIRKSCTGCVCVHWVTEGLLPLDVKSVTKIHALL